MGGGTVIGFRWPHLSPDNKQVSFSMQADIWVRDLARGHSTRFTFHPGAEYTPIWSPDGGRIVFSSEREGQRGLCVKSAVGAGQEELLLKTGNLKLATDWASSGRWRFVVPLPVQETEGTRPLTVIQNWLARAKR
jgi:Tol biopolymer transport system component